jgi:Zn-dependent protease with chaperone function
VLSDVTLGVSNPSELQYIIARELGYVDAGYTWKVALTGALLLIFGTAISVAIADRIGFRRDDDPVSRLALVGALLGVMYLIAVPINDAVLRRLSVEADQYALSLQVDRAEAVRTVVRETDQRLVEVCPDVMDRLFIERIDDPAKRVSAMNHVPSTCP